ncbi:hypothetical protein [Kocuria aegyptia]|uniref:Helix-turn-helix domain-containing protein n=1 Tax=Kocuria aegyptia TaxID=330943 RepID=A0ABN2L462_9MICC
MSAFSIFKWHEAFRGVPSDVLGHAKKVVLFIAATHADGQTGRSIYPSFDTLCIEADADRKTVREAMRDGEELGFVDLVKRGTTSDGRKLANEYRLTMPNPERLEALCAEARAKHEEKRERHNGKRRKGAKQAGPRPVDSAAPSENRRDSLSTCGEPVPTGEDSLPTRRDPAAPHQHMINPSSIQAIKAPAASSVSVPAGLAVDRADEDKAPASAAEAPAAPRPQDGCLIEDHAEDKSEEQRQDMDHDEPNAEEDRDMGIGPEADQLDRLQQQDVEEVPAPPEWFEDVPATDEEPTHEGPDSDAPAPAYEDHAVGHQWAQGETEVPHHQDTTPTGDAPADTLKARRANGDPARLRSITTVSSTALDTPADLEVERRRQLDALHAKYPDTAA